MDCSAGTLSQYFSVTIDHVRFCTKENCGQISVGASEHVSYRFRMQQGTGKK